MHTEQEFDFKELQSCWEKTYNLLTPQKGTICDGLGSFVLQFSMDAEARKFY